MSPIFTYESEFTCVISPTRLFKDFVLDADNLIPKTAPQAGLEGDGDVGTIKKISFRGASNIIDGRVMDTLLSSNCVIEDAPESIEKICYESKLVASGHKGTNVSMSAGSTSSYAKHSFNGIDKVNFVSSYSVIDGASDSMKKICYETKLMASGSGTMNKRTGEYRFKGDVEIKAGHVKAGKEKVL